MLQTQTVDSPTLELLKSLQDRYYLKQFYLVGGTALALYLGHRRSIDIDLFSNFDFDVARTIELLQQDFSLQINLLGRNTLKGSINNINVDIIAHKYPLLNEPAEIAGIRMLSEPDIIAMKLNAISVSGQRSKDFIDIFFAMENDRYSVADMLKFYQTKYSQEGEMHILKSLIYFDDVDLSDWPVLIRRPGLKWSDVCNRINKKVLHFMKTGGR
jgi:hypothetical protein